MDGSFGAGLAAGEGTQLALFDGVMGGGDAVACDPGALAAASFVPMEGVRIERPDVGGTWSGYLMPEGGARRSRSWIDVARGNAEAITLARALQQEGRAATEAERELLSLYRGWGSGGINELFQKPYMQSDRWREAARDIRAALGEDAWASAERNTQYGHYTPEVVARGMWAGLQAMGFDGGRVLDLGMGHGLLAQCGPQDLLARSTYCGVEVDSDTAGIARALMPEARVLVGDMASTSLAKGYFDAVIMNPPFASTTMRNAQEPALRGLSLHNYFVMRALNALRPGGVMALLVSRYFLDARKQQARRMMAEKAELVGGVRLPSSAFSQESGSEVVTDLLFFRRRDAEAVDAQWIGSGDCAVEGGEVAVNMAVQDGAVPVIGRMEKTGQNQTSIRVEVADGDADKALADGVDALVGRLPRGAYEPAAVTVEAPRDRVVDAQDVSEGALFVENGELLRAEGGLGVSVMDAPVTGKLSQKDRQWLMDYVGLRDAVKQARAKQIEDAEDWADAWEAAKSAYEGFVKRHGRVRDNTRVERSVEGVDGESEVRVFFKWKNKKRLAQCVESPIVEMLEAVDDDGVVSDGEFLQRRVLAPPQRAPIEGVEDALLACLAERGGVLIPVIAEMVGMSDAAVVEALGEAIFELPAGGWTTSDDYLSGDVVDKLADAELAAMDEPRFERNVRALKAVQPAPLGPADISVSLGANWIATGYYEDFAEQVLKKVVRIGYIDATNIWSVDDSYGKRSARDASHEWGTSDRSASELLDAALNGRTVKVMRKVFEGGKSKQVQDPDASAACNDIIGKMQERFRTWIWEDAERAKAVCDSYNRRLNRLVPRRFRHVPLRVPGLAEQIQLYPHQERAIWRIVMDGTTYLAHAVGAGKTLVQVVAAMELRRLGRIRRPVFAVPNHMLSQFAAEFMQAFPGANIMVADEEGFHTSRRARFVAQAAMNDPDAIIMTHSSFGLLATKQESRDAVGFEMLSELELMLEQDGDSSGEDKLPRFARKAMERQKEALERRLDGMTNTKSKEVVYFEDLGADFLVIDEAHEFRKLDFATNRGHLKGIDPNGSARSVDLLVKMRWANRQHPGFAGIFASGTPIVNTLAELYTVLRYIAPEELEKAELGYFDAWASNFGESARMFEQNAAGVYEYVERFSRFVNCYDLMPRWSKR